MAANRFTVITLKKRDIFTFEITSIIFCFIVPVAIFSAVCTQWLFPCCRFIPDQAIMAFSFIDLGTYSYSNLMIYFYNVTNTCTLTICYVFVVRSIRMSNNAIISSIQKQRRSQEIRYLVQFVFISIFYIFTWVLFELLPYIVPVDQPQWFFLLPILVTINCSSNSIIYLSVNPEVQKSLQISWLRNKLSPKMTNVIQVAPIGIS